MLLGGFEFWLDGREFELGRSAARVIAFLTLHPRHVSRSTLAGSLWPNATEEHAAANLRTSLWQLGRLDHGIVQTTRGRLALGDWVASDYREALDLALDLILGRIADIDARRLLAADVLPDWDEPWLSTDRERFRQLRLHALETISSQEVAAGNLAWAIDAALTAVRADPYRESSRRALINAYLHEGNVRLAVDEYRSFSRTLSEDLGVQPTDEIPALFMAAGYRLRDPGPGSGGPLARRPGRRAVIGPRAKRPI